MPVGWFRTPSNSSNKYSITVDTNIKHGDMASVSIRSVCGDETEFGSIGQIIAADEYRGKRVRLSGWLRTENAHAGGFWMRVDGDLRSLGFDNMMDRSVRDTTDWKEYSVVLEVPDNAVNIVIGALIVGKGQIWVDDLRMEIVDLNIASTNRLSEFQIQNASPRKGSKRSEITIPVNLGFEDGVDQK